MEQIPEVRDNDIGITLSRRYSGGQGGFEVSISYAGQYICRYPLVVITDRFLQCILNNIPVMGWWLFSSTNRKAMIVRAYSAAITEFVDSIKMDIGNSLLAQGLIGE